MVDGKVSDRQKATDPSQIRPAFVWDTKHCCWNKGGIVHEKGMDHTSPASTLLAQTYHSFDDSGFGCSSPPISIRGKEESATGRFSVLSGSAWSSVTPRACERAQQCGCLSEEQNLPA